MEKSYGLTEDELHCKCRSFWSNRNGESQLDLTFSIIESSVSFENAIYLTLTV